MIHEKLNSKITKNIGIVIPTYNEEKNISKLIAKIKKKLKKPIIIVVDDSRDKKTLNLVKRKKLKIDFIHRGKKLGRGSAVILGLKKLIKSKKVKIFIEMDADLSHAPDELIRNINFFYKNSLDLLIGSKYEKKSIIINWPISRRVFSMLVNFLVRNLLGIPINDFTNGYRIYSKRSVKKIIKNCGRIGDGFIILSEIIVELYISNYKIKEIESVFVNRKRGESSVNLKLIFDSLFGLIKLFFNKRKKINLVSKNTI